MSVLRCNNCEALIDTDFDVEAYSPKLDEWWCEPCRANWRGWDDEEEDNGSTRTGAKNDDPIRAN